MRCSSSTAPRLCHYVDHLPLPGRHRRGDGRPDHASRVPGPSSQTSTSTRSSPRSSSATAELRGKPVIVGGGGANARRGQRPATRLGSSASTRRCHCDGGPALSRRDLPAGRRGASQASPERGRPIRRFTPLVEPISIDEAFLDVTGTAALFGDGPTIGVGHQAPIREEVQLTASVGVATTKLVAKIASDLRNPTAWSSCRRATRRRSSRRCRSRGCGASARRRPWLLADYRVRRDRRSGGARRRTCGPALRQARGRCWSRGAGIDADRVSTRARRSRSGTSTPSTSTRPTPRSSSARSWPWPTACRPAALGRRAGTIARQDPRLVVPDDHPPADPAGPTDLTEPIYRVALELARPEVRGMRVRLLGVTASNLGSASSSGCSRPTTPRGGRSRPPARCGAVRLTERTRGRLLGTGLPAPFERSIAARSRGRPWVAEGGR